MRPCLFITFCFVSVFASAQTLLTVTPSNQPPYDPNALIDHFFTGAGIDVLNVEFAGKPEAVGFFSGGSNAAGVERGLILTTGSAASDGTQQGAEETGSVFASTNNGSTAVSNALQMLSTGPLYDVLYYKITFRPSSDSIRFRYVFASEEYPEYACTYFNDIFGFFLSGPKPGGGEQYNDFNIALVPNTNLPVAINNVHPFNEVTADCFPTNVQYYIDNNTSSNQPVYDGLTTPFIAEAAVVPCETYEMTIALADVGDGVFDTGVFLEGNSFGGAIDIQASFNPGENVIPENAIGDTIDIALTDIPASALPLTITIGGEAENGVDYLAVDPVYTISTADTMLHVVFQPIPDSLLEGLETIVVNVSGPGCLARQFTLFIADPDSSMLQGNIYEYALVGGTAHLDAIPTTFSGQERTFSNTNYYQIEPVDALIASPVTVDLPYSNLGTVKAVKSVCMNIEHTWLDDLDVFLIAPDERFVELTSNNGGNGDNYTGTCFSPEATLPINYPGPFAPASAAPFTGEFQVEGKWTDILNTPVNGTWKLGLVDENAGFIGGLINWNITFSMSAVGNFKYLWSTGDTTQTIDVNAPGTYTVDVSNAVSHFVRTFIVSDAVNSVDEQNTNAASLLVWPNPARDQVNLSWDKNLTVQNIQVFDRFGRVVMEENTLASSQSHTMRTTGLSVGTYFIVLKTASGTITRKLTKEK
ncbi:MAG: choice-of-anchor L domain-containing protein [Saprospiraceae bacterium]|nr:choice-of-anchor L domain-containing protein [Saprospiraceae bacterium]